VPTCDQSPGAVRTFNARLRANRQCVPCHDLYPEVHTRGVTIATAQSMRRRNARLAAATMCIFSAQSL
jgi:hypothetical protein